MLFHFSKIQTKEYAPKKSVAANITRALLAKDGVFHSNMLLKCIRPNNIKLRKKVEASFPKYYLLPKESHALLLVYLVKI